MSRRIGPSGVLVPFLIAALAFGLTVTFAQGPRNLTRSDLPIAAGPGHPAESASYSIARVWNEELLAAIRIDFPRPTVHARNLFHLSVGMWDAWAAYDPSARGFLVDTYQEADDVAAARHEAISYAAYRVLTHRFVNAPFGDVSLEAFEARLVALGYDPAVTTREGDSPAALGNRIARTIIDFGMSDGANEQNDYADDSGYAPVNPVLDFELPGTTMADPNRWQPLAFDFLVLQNGIIIGETVQEFLNPNWGQVTTFGLTEDQLDQPNLYLDPGPPPMLGGVGDQQFRDNVLQVIRYNSWVDPADGETIDISPGAFHNNSLGTQDGTGYPFNPATSEPYAPNVVPRADYVRVLAEFWADGPSSETPPGHWNSMANYVADHPDFEKRIAGTGPILDGLEWDVKVYLALNGALHDAAVAGWGCKGHYDYSRPISHIRYMGGLGQSSDPDELRYHPDGLPLIPGLIEMITRDSSAPGERHYPLRAYRNQIAVRAWRGAPDDPENEIGGVDWIRAVDWMPYQSPSFVTPPFAGYVSGHSTFSRAGAEVLTAMTGSPFFPGGLGVFVAPKDEFLEFENGPSETVTLTWATYYDAADEAGVSRLFGGIHPAADDFPGRVMGSTVGKLAHATALEYFEVERATVCHIPPGNPAKARTITVDPSAVPAHYRHGDHLGECSEHEFEEATNGKPRDRARPQMRSR
jgi:hypothetical protein